MKIAINSCFGGFSLSPLAVQRLSPLAVQRLAQLQGKECYFFTGFKELEGPKAAGEVENNMFFSAYLTPVPYKQPEDWHTLTPKQRQESNDAYDKIALSARPDDRTDPLLIQVIEELGEKADGCCAKIKIVEIPDGTNYVIEEYDGRESIHEAHQSWH